MDNLIFRRAVSRDMGDILQMELDVFAGEQKIPVTLIPLPAEKFPRWWCASIDTSIVGAVAAWKENDQIHWGRFAIGKSYRGLHIGTKLARYSLDDLFSQQVEEVYIDARDATVKIICNLGGNIIGEPITFYNDDVTPVILKKKFFNQNAS